jgi:hypothetical protein
MPMWQYIDNQQIEMIYEANALFASEREVYGFGTVNLCPNHCGKSDLSILGKSFNAFL